MQNTSRAVEGEASRAPNAKMFLGPWPYSHLIALLSWIISSLYR